MMLQEMFRLFIILVVELKELIGLCIVPVVILSLSSWCYRKCFACAKGLGAPFRALSSMGNQFR